MSNAVFEVLKKVTTATITTMLLKKGIRRCWMNGIKPSNPTGKTIRTIIQNGLFPGTM